MTVALLVDFNVQTVHASKFALAVQANARTSLDRETGCLHFDVCRSAEKPNLFFLYELYADEEAVAAHLKTPHFNAFDAATRLWVVAKQVRLFRLDHLEDGA